MLGTEYADQNCSAARALEVVGERWTLLIVRDALFRAATRFTDFERGLGLARNVLTARLETLVRAGVMTRRPVGAGGRHDYVLTEKGRDLAPVVMALTAWGDRWSAPDGPPIVFGHHACAGRIGLAASCDTCAAPVDPAEIAATPGPGARLAPAD